VNRIFSNAKKEKDELKNLKQQGIEVDREERRRMEEVMLLSWITWQGDL